MSCPVPPALPAVATRLVTSRDDVAQPTANRETDVRTALTRGLAEYLSQLSNRDGGAGREVRFQNVLQTWADPETLAAYPSAVVYATGAGDYDASSFTPNVSKQDKVTDCSYLFKPCEYQLDITVEIWATDTVERAMLCMMVEDGLNPLDFMYGVRLELPHYFNLRATYELLSLAYADSDLEAMQRYRKAEFIVRGHVSVARLVQLPEGLPRQRVEVE